jgi:hypothetical protein
VPAIDTTHLIATLRAIGPTLIALISLVAVPLARHPRFGVATRSNDRAERVVISLLFASGILAFLAGSDYRSSALIGGIPIDPSEPGRLLVALGAPTFALIVVVGGGRRIGTMGQIALFGLAAIDLALAVPDGLAPVAILIFGSIGLSAFAAGSRGDAARARAVFRDLRAAAIALPLLVTAELLRSAIPLSATDANYATPTSLGAGAALALAAVLMSSTGVFPFHHRLVRIFETLPIVGSLLIGVWLPTALSLIVMGEISSLAAGVPEQIGGAVVPALLIAGAVAIAFGGASALLHDDIGEVVGFLAVGNAGWLALAAAALLINPDNDAARLLPVPGALSLSLFGLWLISIRKQYEVTAISDLGGWARRTPVYGVILIAGIIAMLALPPGEIIAAKINVLTAGGNPIIAIVAALGQLGLVASAVRILLVGFTVPSRPVRLAALRKLPEVLVIAILFGAITIAGAAAGWLSIASRGAGPLPSAPPLSSPTAPAPVPNETASPDGSGAAGSPTP